MKAQEQKPRPYFREPSTESGTHGISEPAVVGLGESRQPSATGSNRLDRIVARRILAMLGDPAIRFRLWDHTELGHGSCSSAPLLWFRDRGALYGVAFDNSGAAPDGDHAGGTVLFVHGLRGLGVPGAGRLGAVRSGGTECDH